MRDWPTAKGGCAYDFVDAHADQPEVALQVCIFVLQVIERNFALGRILFCTINIDIA